MTGESIPGKKGQKPSRKAKAQAARLMAVQAVFQTMTNPKAADIVTDEYLVHRIAMEIEGETMIEPDGALFSAIVKGVDTRRDDLNSIIDHNLSNKTKEIDKLIRALLLAATWELMTAHETDAAILINDYLNVAHGFFDAGEVSLINGVLNAVAKALRA